MSGNPNFLFQKTVALFIINISLEKYVFISDSQMVKNTILCSQFMKNHIIDWVWSIILSWPKVPEIKNIFQRNCSFWKGQQLLSKKYGGCHSFSNFKIPDWKKTSFFRKFLANNSNFLHFTSKNIKINLIYK